MVYDSHNSGQEKLSYDDARNRCKDLNKKADLISIKSGKDYDQLSSLAGILSPNEYWIGGFDQGIWDYKNGKLVKTNREWRWVDGTKMTYTNWGMYFYLDVCIIRISDIYHCLQLTNTNLNINTNEKQPRTYIVLTSVFLKK